MIPLSDKQLCAFIKQNAEWLTIADMVEETGCTRHVIDKACERLGVTPLSVKEKTHKFILENKSLMTAKKIMHVLDIGETHFIKICKEIGLDRIKDFKHEIVEDPIDKVLVKRLGRTPREILADFQQDSSIHYNHIAQEPNPMAELWARRILNIESKEDKK